MWKHAIIFFCVVAIAALFRFTGMNWDQNAHLHPDERFLTMVATNIEWPQSIIEYFDTKTSPLNPHNRGFSFYVYGTYPVYVTKLVTQLLGKYTYDGIPRVGRTLSGIVDLFTLIFVFLLAGNLAAFLYAVMVLPIQQSHFFTVDPYATLFLTISFYLLVKKRIGWQLGIAVGLAISAKISSVLILPIVIWQSRKKLISLLWFFLTMLATIRVFYPYLFDGWGLNELVLANWRQLKSFDGPQTSFPPGLQWIGVPVWQPTLDLILWGLGLPLGAVALVSLLKRPNLLFVSWVVLVLGYQSFQFAKAMRYLYPTYPAISILTALFIRKYRLYWILPIVIVWPITFVSIYMRPHTRVAASDWIYANIPAGRTLAWEHWDDPLPIARDSQNIGMYNTIQLPVYDPDSQSKWQNLSQKLENTDYIVLSSNRTYGGIRHAKIRFPQTNRYYELLFSGKLGFEKAAEFTSRPWIFIDDNAEESFTVYDHPKVMIFTNKKRLKAEQLYALIYK